MQCAVGRARLLRGLLALFLLSYGGLLYGDEMGPITIETLPRRKAAEIQAAVPGETPGASVYTDARVHEAIIRAIQAALTDWLPKELPAGQVSVSVKVGTTLSSTAEGRAFAGRVYQPFMVLFDEGGRPIFKSLYVTLTRPFVLDTNATLPEGSSVFLQNSRCRIWPPGVREAVVKAQGLNASLQKKSMEEIAAWRGKQIKSLTERYEPPLASAVAAVRDAEKQRDALLREKRQDENAFLMPKRVQVTRDGKEVTEFLPSGRDRLAAAENGMDEARRARSELEDTIREEGQVLQGRVNKMTAAVKATAQKYEIALATGEPVPEDRIVADYEAALADTRM